MKEVNLLGIREKTMLCRTSGIKGGFNVILRKLNEDEEKELDDNQRIIIDNVSVSKDNILCYGQINLDVDEDYNFINKLKLINDDDIGNDMPTNIDWLKGVAYTNTNVLSYSPTWDVMKWFEYNYMLIGRPNRIIIYKVRYEKR